MSRKTSSVIYAVIACAVASLIMLVFWGPSDDWTWDPSFYYAQLRSPIIDHDLDIGQEVNTGNRVLPLTRLGLTPSLWPLGPSILWSPFFLAAHGLVSLANPAKANGLVFPYITLVSLGSLIYGILGLVMIFKLCRRYTGGSLAVISTGLCLLATPLFFHMFRQPLMAHTTGLLASATLVMIFLLLTQDKLLVRYSGLLFGVFLGLNMLTRYIGLLMFTLPLVYYGAELWEARNERSMTSARALLGQVIVFVVTFAVTISPQLVFWRDVNGSFIINPQGPAAYVGGLVPINLLKFFGDTNRGLLLWQPFALISVVGVFFIPEKKLKLAALLYLAALIIMIGYRRDWYSGGSFGQRYLIESLPYLAIGFVCLTRNIYLNPFGKMIVFIGSGLIAFHQLALLYSFERGLENWIDLAAYFRGTPIGASWQLKSLAQMVASPVSWFEPRAHVGQDRQAVLTNLLHGVHTLRAYRFTGPVVILTPALVLSFILLQRKMNSSRLPALAVTIMSFMAAWAIYLAIIG